MKRLAAKPLIQGRISLPFCMGILCLLGATLSLPGFAQPDTEGQRLREEVAAGRILPLQSILDLLLTDYVGEVISVELDMDDGIRLYEIELLGPQGQIVEFEIAARTGVIMKIEGSNLSGMKRP
ncbi:MAG: PepSY domain-containing protein [Pseudohongiella sp.]|uniref:PepSY domain-containing protein n=1 Tax=Pseudohongiella sp. TaxID=1979412 RepID=UPI0034A00FA7